MAHRPDPALTALIKLAEQSPEVRPSAAPFVLPAPYLRQIEDLQRLIDNTDLADLEAARDIAEVEIQTAFRRDESDFAEALTTIIEFIDSVLDIAPPTDEEE